MLWLDHCVINHTITVWSGHIVWSVCVCVEAKDSFWWHLETHVFNVAENWLLQLALWLPHALHKHSHSKINVKQVSRLLMTSDNTCGCGGSSVASMRSRVQIPRTHIKKPGIVAFAWNPNTEAETVGTLPLLASLTDSVSFSPVRDSVAKSKVNWVWRHTPLIPALWGRGRWSSLSARSTW